MTEDVCPHALCVSAGAADTHRLELLESPPSFSPRTWLFYLERWMSRRVYCHAAFAPRARLLQAARRHAVASTRSCWMSSVILVTFDLRERRSRPDVIASNSLKPLRA